MYDIGIGQPYTTQNAPHNKFIFRSWETQLEIISGVKKIVMAFRNYCYLNEKQFETYLLEILHRNISYTQMLEKQSLQDTKPRIHLKKNNINPSKKTDESKI